MRMNFSIFNIMPDDKRTHCEGNKARLNVQDLRSCPAGVRGFKSHPSHIAYMTMHSTEFPYGMTSVSLLLNHLSKKHNTTDHELDSKNQAKLS